MRRPNPQRELYFRVRVLENALPLLDKLARSGLHGLGSREEALTSIVRNELIKQWEKVAKP